MSRHDAWISIEVSDDGRGFDPGSMHDGFGLLFMQERIMNLGGGLRIESRSGEGTRVKITVDA